MIFIAVAVLIVTIVRYSRAVRREKSFAPLAEIGFCVLAGLLAGVFLGVAARGGMAAITIANGSSPRFSWSGTLKIIGVYTGFGGALGIAYAGLFRHRLDRNGMLFAVLLGVTSAIPLTHSARQLLVNPLPTATLVTVSAFALALLWIPYAVALEVIVARLRRWSSTRRVARSISSAK